MNYEEQVRADIKAFDEETILKPMLGLADALTMCGVTVGEFSNECYSHLSEWRDEIYPATRERYKEHFIDKIRRLCSVPCVQIVTPEQQEKFAQARVLRDAILKNNIE